MIVALNGSRPPVCVGKGTPGDGILGGILGGMPKLGEEFAGGGVAAFVGTWDTGIIQPAVIFLVDFPIPYSIHIKKDLLAGQKIKSLHYV